MFRYISRLIGMMALFSVLAMPMHAQTQVPILEFHTQLYEMYGVDHSFYFEIGATENTYIEVDFGYGTTECKVGYAEFDPDLGYVSGTMVSGSVGPEGIVRVYGDPLKIDYLDLLGIYIDRLDVSRLINIEILDVRHNRLQELDLSHMKHLSAVYLGDNPFDVKPLLLGPDHPELTHLRIWEKEYEVPEKDTHGLPPNLRFSLVIRKAYEQTGKKVVILIDEYDKPILNSISDSELADDFRSQLKTFYSNLKSMDDYIEIAVMTGVARFSKVSIFSDLNNLRDISFEDQFAGVCGVTTEELNVYFQTGI